MSFQLTVFVRVTLSLSLLGNLIALLYQSNIILGVTNPKYTYIDDDHPRNVPLAVGSANMVFQSKMEYLGMGNDHQTWAEWEMMRPTGAGYLFLGETYLPVDVSMWHQIHCLNHLRTLISRGDDGSDHTLHCFHYIRQGILCNADATLEPRQRASFDVDGNEIFPGDGITHTCRDFQYIYEWTTKQNEGWSEDQKARSETIGSMKGGNNTMNHGGMHMHGAMS